MAQSIIELLKARREPPHAPIPVGDSPTLSIAGDVVTYVSPEGEIITVTITELFAAAQRHLLESQTGVLPRNVILSAVRGPRTVWVGEFPPATYVVKWIRDDSPADFGAETAYDEHVIALPYVIVFAVFDGAVLTQSNECFFRTAPLNSLDDELLHPALLNVSSFKNKPEFHDKPRCWICTQHLNTKPIARERDPQRRMRVGWQALAEVLFDSAFNRSSEHHEGSSWFAESKHLDDRISTIEKWDAATRADAMFVLDVPFEPSGLTARQMLKRLLHPKDSPAAEPTTHDLARLMVNSHTAARKPR